MADWIPSLAVLAAFTPAVVLIALTPGPDMTLFLAKTLGQSRAAGLAAMSGAVTGLVVHALFAAFGLSALLAASETAFMTVKIAGAGYLLWLAFEAIRHGSAFTADHDGSRRQRLGEIYVTGLGINLLNPKIVLFFITFLPQFVSHRRSAGRRQADVPRHLFHRGVGPDLRRVDPVRRPGGGGSAPLAAHHAGLRLCLCGDHGRLCTAPAGRARIVITGLRPALARRRRCVRPPPSRRRRRRVPRRQRRVARWPRPPSPACPGRIP
jgi:threonine/homoserine/homoserine lactone efflux protein